MFFNIRIIITFNSFASETTNSQVFTHSDVKMTFSFAIIDSIPATTLKLVNNVRTKEWWNFVFKDTHRENTISAYKIYGYGHLGSWYIKSNQQEVLKLKQNFQKTKVVTGKIPFFLIGPFCTHHCICLNIGFLYDSFVWKWCLFILSAFS